MNVKEIRRRAGLSQARFAEVLGVKPGTVQAWEQNRRPVTTPMERFINLIEFTDGWKQ